MQKVLDSDCRGVRFEPGPLGWKSSALTITTTTTTAFN